MKHMVAKVVCFMCMMAVLNVSPIGAQLAEEDLTHPANIVVLYPEEMECISSYEGNRIVFHKTTPILRAVTVGNMIVGGGVTEVTPHGLRPQKVVKIEKGGQGLIFTTSTKEMERFEGRIEIDIDVIVPDEEDAPAEDAE